MALVLIGIDDTDNADSAGTGRLARSIVEQIEQRGGVSRGITRHPFLIDERVPYTRHNRGICVGVDWPRPLEELDFVMDRVAEWSAPGSDPGVCIALADSVSPEMVDWGLRASRDVLFMHDATTIAAASRVRLQSLGGTGQGIIGALACVGLRSHGNTGRFVDLPLLRQLDEFVSRRDLSRLGIEVEHVGSLMKIELGTENDSAACYKTFGWVRPRLIHGKAVWPVQWSDELHAWVGVDRRKENHLGRA